MDELGRGTSTSEGMAIAQAVIEYVHDTIGCKSLVSTHFHELAHLEESLHRLRNYSMAVQESGENVHFLRKLVPGPASSSYGIYCARLAGLPSRSSDGLTTCCKGSSTERPKRLRPRKLRSCGTPARDKPGCGRTGQSGGAGRGRRAAVDFRRRRSAADAQNGTARR
ncbi:hypothetical protein VQ056_10740 [Paenibacillus sp. JTLBN-2024]